MGYFASWSLVSLAVLAAALQLLKTDPNMLCIYNNIMKIYINSGFTLAAESCVLPSLLVM